LTFAHSSRTVCRRNDRLVLGKIVGWRRRRLRLADGRSAETEIATLLSMGSLKKRRKAKINKHKRRKKLRAHRHKKRTWQK
jgi:hypothetical protein